MPRPSVGRIVHYVSFGTPGGEYQSECRAAIIAAVPAARWEGDAQPVDLVVLNPTGMFFNQRCAHDAGSDVGGVEVPVHHVYPGGSWHWPERVEE